MDGTKAETTRAETLSCYLDMLHVYVMYWNLGTRLTSTYQHVVEKNKKKNRNKNRKTEKKVTLSHL